MNYLAQMLRDCSKNRISTFTEISFPIIQEIQNKIKTKNLNLRKKMRQRLNDRQKISKVEDKKDDLSNPSKKDSNGQKVEKEIVNYIQAYDEQKTQPTKAPCLQADQVKLDEKEAQTTFLIYLLMRKRKSIFKIDEVRRKLRSKENPKRMNLKECDCCEKVGKHKCLHRFCENKCKELRKSEKVESVAAQDFDEELEAIEIAQEIIEAKVKEEDLSLNIVKIIQKDEEAISIPKIDITEKEEQLKEEAENEILHERQRISENQSKSQISEGKRNRSSEHIKQKQLIKQTESIANPKPISNVDLNQSEMVNEAEERASAAAHSEIQAQSEEEIQDDLMEAEFESQLNQNQPPNNQIYQIEQPIESKVPVNPIIQELPAKSQSDKIPKITSNQKDQTEEVQTLLKKQQKQPLDQQKSDQIGNFLDDLLFELGEPEQKFMGDSQMREE